ncbi:hypothetical protein HDV02_005975, partial [Globomyces sp. JEL0801]
MDKSILMQRMERIGMKWKDLLYVLGIDEEEMEDVLETIKQNKIASHTGMHIHQLPLEILVQTAKYLNSSDALKLSSCSKQSAPLRQYIFGNRKKLVVKSPVQTVPQFIKHYIRSVKISDCDDQNKLNLHFKSFKTFSDIREVDIFYRKCFDIALLSKFRHLQKLRLYTSGIKDLSSISRFENLQDLEISDIGSISVQLQLDISVICTLPHLRKISITDVNIINTAAFSNMIYLKDLELTSANISDISDLSTLVNMVNLNLSHNAISDIKALKNMKKLKTLKLATENLLFSDTDLLLHFPNLIELELSGYQITDISFLSTLLGLKSLTLNGNKISDLSPLKPLTKLECLIISHNQITDVSVLSNLIKLKTLDLEKNF